MCPLRLLYYILKGKMRLELIIPSHEPMAFNLRHVYVAVCFKSRLVSIFGALFVESRSLDLLSFFNHPHKPSVPNES